MLLKNWAFRPTSERPYSFTFLRFSALEHLGERNPDPRRRTRHFDARPLHRRDLVLGAAFSSRNYGASVAHGPALRRCQPGDEAGHRFLAAAFGFVDQE